MVKKNKDNIYAVIFDVLNKYRFMNTAEKAKIASEIDNALKEEFGKNFITSPIMINEYLNQLKDE